MGINLIVDETTTDQKTASGNSVGKTTVLRLIDFCLDGDGKNIYVDPEFKTTNTRIEKFLTENNILISLALAESLKADQTKDLVITRNFLKYGKKVQMINGENYSNSEFSETLKSIIFKSTTKHPTFKQLKSKNIRDEKYKLMNTIRVLSPNVVTDAVYEALHLFWFGIDIGASKDQLIRDKNLEEKLQTRLRKESNLSQVNQALIVVGNEIDRLAMLKDNFNLNEEYEDQFLRLNSVKSQINQFSSELSRMQIRRELIIESTASLDDALSNIDAAQIRRLYESANALIPNLQRTFEETLEFHNSMVRQKIAFIEEELPSLENTMQLARHELDSLLVTERELTEALNKSGAIEELQEIIASLTTFHERKGALEEQKDLWERTNKTLAEIESKLEIANKEVESRDELIQERIAQFNAYFSSISSKLDGVHSLLSADNPDGIYKFTIGNIEGNPGTGTKKSQMASFDLAYIKFADSLEIPCLHFVLQDQIENVHSNQITNLLKDIVTDVNCQYVLPVLRDKLPAELDIESLEVLTLSQDDKLFRI
ncbi:DUF2326 domain-containing protein [Parahaliea aestuarii]|nr:DUF2326 domain-containing protein [Parahaliea aestuarii]